MQTQATITPSVPTDSVGTMKPQPILPLTSLRFFAALGVVLFHSWVLFLPHHVQTIFYQDYVSLGANGVSFFYVLSGFVLSYRHYHGPFLALDPKKFWIARFARIYPLYIVALVLVAPLVLTHNFACNSLVAALKYSLVSLFTNVILLQAWYPPLRNNWNPPGWSVSAEAFFYCLFPVLGMWIWKIKPKYGFLFLALICWLASLLVPLAVMGLCAVSAKVAGLHAVSKMLVVHYKSLEALLTSSPLLRLPEFGMGIITAKLAMDVRDRWSAFFLNRVANACVCLALICLVFVFVIKPYVSHLVMLNGLLSPIFAALIFGLTNSRSPLTTLLSSRPLVVLGEASYSTYLIHVPLLWWFLGLHTPHLALSGYLKGIGETTSNIPLYGGYLCLVVVLSILSFYGIERPMRRWIIKKAQVRFRQIEARCSSVLTDTNRKEMVASDASF